MDTMKKKIFTHACGYKSRTESGIENVRIAYRFYHPYEAQLDRFAWAWFTLNAVGLVVKVLKKCIDRSRWKMVSYSVPSYKKIACQRVL